MVARFFDTSAVVKHYRVETGTAQVDALLAEAGALQVISQLCAVEIHSVFARLVRIRQITAADFNLARQRFLADVTSSLWKVVPVSGTDYHRAQQLLVQHGPGRGLRTLDALQLAVALELNAVGPLDSFVCADTNLCQVAAAEGLAVVNPEAP